MHLLTFFLFVLTFLCSFLSYSFCSSSFSFSPHPVTRLVQFQHFAHPLGSSTPLAAVSGRGALVTPDSSCSSLDQRFVLFSPHYSYTLSSLTFVLSCSPLALLLVLPDIKMQENQSIMNEFHSIESHLLSHSISFPFYFVSSDDEITSLLSHFPLSSADRENKEKNSSYLSDSLQFQLVSPSGIVLESKISDSLLSYNFYVSLLAGDNVKRRGENQVKQSKLDNHRATIAIVANIDSFSITPSTPSGSHSTGSSTIALISLLTSFSHRFDQLAPNKNLLFLLNSGSRWNYLGDKHYL
jgi:hypothetical protein